MRVILEGIERNSYHNGGGLAWGPDGMLYAGTGDAGEPSRAQDPASLNGKILRMDVLGRPPSDDPMPGSVVFSLGHRNVQGLAWDGDGRMWATEFGSNAFDEVNLVEAGENYCWPEVEGVGDPAGGRFVDPVVTWSTDDASPSGAAIVATTLYVGALRGQRLWAVPLEGAAAVRPGRSEVAGPQATGVDGQTGCLAAMGAFVNVSELSASCGADDLVPPAARGRPMRGLHHLEPTRC